MKVAVLGTGKMGAAVARRLVTQGDEVLLWNRTRERAEAVGVGQVASTAADAVAGAEIAITVLTGPEAARATYAGEHGALESAADRVFIDLTTGGPDSAIRLDGEVREAGGRYVEAPVLGGPAAIEGGKLVVLVGGDPAALDAARPVIAKLGEVRHIGEIGSASKLKLVANSMLAGVSALAAELQAAGEEAGLPREDVFWALQRLAPALEMRKAGFLEQRYQPVFFTMRDMLKDIDLALELYRRAGAESPLVETARALFADVVEANGGDDLSAINARFRRRAEKPKG